MAVQPRRVVLSAVLASVRAAVRSAVRGLAVLTAVILTLGSVRTSAAEIGDRDLEAIHIQTMIDAAWDDATRTWERLLGARLYGSNLPKLNFVPRVSAAHCYGLYINPGPVYCSGNATVFLSVAAMEDIQRRYPDVGDAGLAFLVAHELGHHIQKVTGRFALLGAMMRQDPRNARRFTLQFELEADCLAGVWAANSPRFAAGADERRAMTASLQAIGDDRILALASGAIDPARLTHGTSAQRTAWFERGLRYGNVSSCDVLGVDRF